MERGSLLHALKDLPIGPVRPFERLGSTNDEAARWADQGAPDLALVVAEEQTAGRGRAGRSWHTPPGAALALSLILKPPFPGVLDAQGLSARLTGLGALAVSQALSQDYHLETKIKWPNDVLLGGRKVAGILVEAHWQGDQIAAVILGIGVNVGYESVPPEAELLFPATCVQAGLENAPPRPLLLRAILAQLLAWRARLGDGAFIDAWRSKLAYLGEWVQVLDPGPAASPRLAGRVTGLDDNGRLQLRDRHGALVALDGGEIHLRPLEHLRDQSSKPGE
jgi:BirA family biotin operon repressor/biotin-[acetyl-CoA-carboxylase] ligase